VNSSFPRPMPSPSKILAIWVILHGYLHSWLPLPYCFICIFNAYIHGAPWCEVMWQYWWLQSLPLLLLLHQFVEP
jgi:hypothetical protein